MDFPGTVAAASPSILVVSLKGDALHPHIGDIAAAHGAPAPPLALDMSPKHHRGFWAMQLDERLRPERRPIVLAAHGVGCLAIARWAQLSPASYVACIAGAIFLSPLDFALPRAALAASLRPSPPVKLPFPSIVADRANSPIIAQVLQLADHWGSRFVDPAAPQSAQRSDVRGDDRPVEDLLRLAFPGRTIEASVEPGDAASAEAYALA